MNCTDLSRKRTTTVAKEVNSISDCSAGFLHHLIIGTFSICKPTGQKPCYSFEEMNLSKIHWAICNCFAISVQDLLFVHYIV